MGYKLEVLCILEAFLWGIWVGNPYWDVFLMSQIFTTLNKIAPEWVWGLIFFLLGSFQLIALIKRKLFLRRILAVLAIFLWTSLWLGMLFGNYQSTAAVIYPIFILMSVLIYTETTFYQRNNNYVS